MQIGALAHGMALRIVLQQCDDRFRDGFWIVERNQHASLVREQLLGVPVRRGDNCLACSQRDGQRAGDDLRFLPVGRDVNIGRAYVLHELFGAHKAIIQNQIGRNTKLSGQRLQLFAVALAFAPANMRMCHSGDDIRDIRMPCQNCRQRANHVFNALVRREQAESKQNGFAFGAKLVLEIVGIHEGHVGNAVRDHIDLSRRNRIHFAQQLGREFAHDHQAIGELRNLFEHDALICIRLAQNRMQRSDQRHFQPAQQNQNVAARGPAVDAVFMLQADEIVAIEVKKIGGPLIRGNVLLRQFQAHLLRIIVAGIGIVDGDSEQASFAVFGCERGAQVGRERGNAALARQIIPHKRDARGQRQAAGFQREQ